MTSAFFLALGIWFAATIRLTQPGTLARVRKCPECGGSIDPPEHMPWCPYDAHEAIHVGPYR